MAALSRALIKLTKDLKRPAAYYVCAANTTRSCSNRCLSARPRSSLYNTSNYIFKYSVNESVRFYLLAQGILYVSTLIAATFKYVKRYHVKNYTDINFNTIALCALSPPPRRALTRCQNLISKDLKTRGLVILVQRCLKTCFICRAKIMDRYWLIFQIKSASKGK